LPDSLDVHANPWEAPRKGIVSWRDQTQQLMA
jgi:hypothetical protein